RCYIDNDEQTMSEVIKSNLSKVKEKSYSDYLEFYVGILLESPGLDGCKIWDTIKGIIKVGLLYYMSKDDKLDASKRLPRGKTSPPGNSSSHSELPALPPHPPFTLPALSHSTTQSKRNSTPPPSNQFSHDKNTFQR